MFDLFKLRALHGSQYVRDVAAVRLDDRFRSFPLLDEDACTKCALCTEACPTGAITVDPLSLDLGSCIFCARCEDACPSGAVRFSSFYKTAATERERLVVSAGTTPERYAHAAIAARQEIQRLFGRSLKLRSVSAGGCNGCEMELAAATNVNFDIGRFGIDIVASPRHADGIVITGPVTKNMAYALEQTFIAAPDPKLIVVFGTCAVSGGLFATSEAVDRSFFNRHPVDLYVPGCPPHPLTLVNGLLGLLRGGSRSDA